MLDVQPLIRLQLHHIGLLLQHYWPVIYTVNIKTQIDAEKQLVSARAGLTEKLLVLSSKHFIGDSSEGIEASGFSNLAFCL